MTLIYEYDLDLVKMKNEIPSQYVGIASIWVKGHIFLSKAVVRTHTRPTDYTIWTTKVVGKMLLQDILHHKISFIKRIRANWPLTMHVITGK